MKSSSQSMIAFAGFVALSLIATAADRTPAWADGSGNQLQQSYTPWYQKAAEKVGPVEGAKSPTLVLKSGSLYLEGDSTLHKYQMHANTLQGSASVTGTDLVKALKADSVKDMSFAVVVKDFKSRESGLDDNAYKALKSADNPNITFTLKSETLKAGDKDGTYAMTAQGELSIAGATNPVTLKADVTVKDGQVELKGVQAVKMSDYQVKPPTISLLVTSITCSDSVDIHYDVTFGKP